MKGIIKMNNTELLKKLRNIKKWNSIDDLDNLINEIEYEITLETSCKKPSEKKALNTLKSLQKKQAKNKEDVFKRLRYVKVFENNMYFTNSYFAVKMPVNEQWIESLEILSKDNEKKYPGVQYFFDGIESQTDVSFSIDYKDVLVWKKTIEKKDRKQQKTIVLKDCTNVTLNVEYLDYIFKLLQADNLTFYGPDKISHKQLVGALHTKNENGTAIICPVLNY